jgi:class 3 adenylate cyclase
MEEAATTRDLRLADGDAMSGELRCFLMSDIEGSNALWATSREQMAAAVNGLDAEVEDAVNDHSGTLLKSRGEGDSHFAVFALASDAVLSACALQSRLAAPLSGLDVRVRIAVHVGEVYASGSDYYGVAVNQTARLRAIGHGGQTLVSSVAAVLAAPRLADLVDVTSLGHHRVRDFPHLEEVFQATTRGSDLSFPPLRTADERGPALMAIAVVDICGATLAMQDLDDREVVDLNLRWAASMRKLAEVHSTNALRLTGDGCIAAFEDPLDCVAFVHDFRASVVDEGFELKAGIDVGRVTLTDGEIVGGAVYRASALERGASRGEIALSRVATELLGLSGSAGSRGRPDSLPDLASAR